LDGEIAREEGWVAEEDVMEQWFLWWWREDLPGV
jgi:hypothetical protein